MRIFICLFICLSGMQYAYSQGVLISPAPGQPNPSAGLDVDFTNKGFLLPRLTTTQRNAIANPAVGLEIYNTTTECIEAYFTSGWQPLGCACTTPPPAPSSINGPLHVCPSEAGVLFSTPVIPGASSYQWVIGNSDVLVSGQGNDSIVVDFSGNYGNRTISVIATNTCGSSNSYSITVNASNPDSGFAFPQPVNINNPATFNAATPNVTYSWSFASGSPASASTQSVPVTWTNTGTYAVSLTVTDADGCTSTNNQSVNVVNCIPATYTFTNCGATGRLGPNQTQCNNTYGPGVVISNNGIQEWVVPTTGNYRIAIAGAQGGHGGNGAYVGGTGAKMEADFALTAGTTLRILVGQQAPTRTITGSNGTGAGSGGTFVTTQNNTPLIVAGGGGGGGSSQSGYSGNTTNNGTQSSQSAGLGGINGGGGGGGQSGSAGTSSSAGGTGSSCSYGAGGAGFYTDGGMNCSGSSPFIQGFSFLNGGAGGPADTGRQGVEGGFGGGAGVGHRASAGGGWSGGGGDGGNGGGGGGGSYINPLGSNVATSDGLYNNASSFNGSPIQNLSSFQTGNGIVVITRVCP